jgi:4-amino-4-deoxy-L-arabinose transferase-like glycosyltransferase
MDIKCPKCGTINKIPDIVKPNVTLRCGKCHYALAVKPVTELNHVRRSRWLQGDTRYERFLRRHGLHSLLAVLGIAGTLLTFFATSRYGAGISADAIAYVTCAKNLAAGAGYTYHSNGQDNVIYVLWPPLFPTFLAGLIKVGLQPLQGARLLNAFAFGLTVFMSAQLFRIFIKSKTLVILATLLVLFSLPIFSYSTMALSEPLFTLLGIVFAIFLLKFLKERRLRFLFLAGLFAALSFLQRYMGVAFILTGGIVIISPLLKSPLWQKFKYAIVFGVVAVTPGAIWVVRNLILTSTIVGERVLSHANAQAHILYENIQYTVRIVGDWFLPGGGQSRYANVELFFGGLAVFLLLIATAASICQRRKTGLDTSFTQAWPVVVLVLVYALYLIASETAVPSESILNPRFLLPIQPFAILLVFIGIENILSFLKERLKDKEFLRYAAIGLCALLILSDFMSVYANAVDWHRSGEGWNSVVVRESPLMEWLKTNRLNGEVYSNEPEHIYFVTGIEAKYIPSLDSITRSLASSPSPGNTIHLVLFSQMQDESSYDFPKLSSALNLEEVTKVSDGAVYLVKSQ